MPALPIKLSPANARITAEMVERMVKIGHALQIEIAQEYVDGTPHLRLAGPGFPSSPVTLPLKDASVRLLSEICGIMTPWVAFSSREPCEVTLMGISDERVARHAATYRTKIAAAKKAEDRANKFKQLGLIPKSEA